MTNDLTNYDHWKTSTPDDESGPPCDECERTYPLDGSGLCEVCSTRTDEERDEVTRRHLLAMFDGALATKATVTLDGLASPLAYDALNVWSATHRYALPLVIQLYPGTELSPHPYVTARVHFGRSVMDGGISVIMARYATEADVEAWNRWQSPTIDPSTVRGSVGV